MTGMPFEEGNTPEGKEILQDPCVVKRTSIRCRSGPLCCMRSPLVLSFSRNGVSDSQRLSLSQSHSFSFHQVLPTDGTTPVYSFYQHICIRITWAAIILSPLSCGPRLGATLRRRCPCTAAAMITWRLERAGRHRLHGDRSVTGR